MARRAKRVNDRETPPKNSVDTPQHRRSKPVRLLTRHQVPPWYSQNNLVSIGYRPVTGSVAACLLSLGYLHNETVNIYSHLVPALVALIANIGLHVHFTNYFPETPLADRIIFHIYLATSTVCFGVSSLYHTLLCHSESYASFWVRLDYVTIFVQILGSFVSGIYLGFYCEPGLQKLYWTMVSRLLIC